MDVPSSTAPGHPPGLGIGDIVAGKYRVERVLGQGGMGMVVAATHIELDQLVAIKVLLPAAAANSTAVERFGREARASAKLRSDNVVHVIDVGSFETGEPFIVMEYLQGVDLAQVLREGGPLTVHDAVDYVLQVCAALAEAHAAGIIHRDLKPANLFLAERNDTVNVVKVVDFGISKVTAGPSTGKLTNTRDLMGSPLYMSPEQLSLSHDIDGRSDIWSLGIIMYELIAGAPPFQDEMLPQLCTAVLVREAPPIVRADLPPKLATVIAKCLEKSTSARYATVGDLALALAEFAPEHSSATIARVARLAQAALPPSLRSQPASSSPDIARAAATGPHGGETASPWAATELKAGPRSSKRAWILGVVLVAGAAALVLAISRPSTLSAWPFKAASTEAPSAPAPVEPSPSSTPSSGVRAVIAPNLPTIPSPSPSPMTPRLPAPAGSSRPAAPFAPLAPLPRPSVAAVVDAATSPSASTSASASASTSASASASGGTAPAAPAPSSSSASPRASSSGENDVLPPSSAPAAPLGP